MDAGFSPDGEQAGSAVLQDNLLLQPIDSEGGQLHGDLHTFLDLRGEGGYGYFGLGHLDAKGQTDEVAPDQTTRGGNLETVEDLLVDWYCRDCARISDNPEVSNVLNSFSDLHFDVPHGPGQHPRCHELIDLCLRNVHHESICILFGENTERGRRGPTVTLQEEFR